MNLNIKKGMIVYEKGKPEKIGVIHHVGDFITVKRFDNDTGAGVPIIEEPYNGKPGWKINFSNICYGNKFINGCDFRAESSEIKYITVRVLEQYKEEE